MAAFAPRRPRGILRPLWTVARVVLCTIAFSALAFTSTVDDPSEPQMYLVDDGGGSSVSEPPYTPSESEGSGSPSDKPGGGDEKQDGDKPGEDKESEDSGLASLPVAAEAGISLGAIMLAGLALIPGRRPPASLRG